MKRFFKAMVFIFALGLMSGCATTGFGPYDSPSSAPQPEGRIHSLPSDPNSTALSVDLRQCQDMYGNAVTEEQIYRYETCVAIAFDKHKATAKGGQLTAKTDLTYRRQTDKELNSEQKRREKTQKANVKTLDALVKTVLKIKKEF